MCNSPGSKVIFFFIFHLIFGLTPSQDLLEAITSSGDLRRLGDPPWTLIAHLLLVGTMCATLRVEKLFACCENEFRLGNSLGIIPICFVNNSTDSWWKNSDTRSYDAPHTYYGGYVRSNNFLSLFLDIEKSDRPPPLESGRIKKITISTIFKRE